MAANSTTTPVTEYPCILHTRGSICIVVGLFAPFHILIVKALICQLHLRLARHKILLSLSISDNIQLLFIVLPILASFIFNVKTTARIACLVIRNLMQFNVLLTVVTSSGSIAALAVERYISCFYCFRVNFIITKKRVKISLCCLWVLGGVAALANIYHRAEHLISEFRIVRLGPLMVVFVSVFTSAIIIIFVQVKLFLLSREKLRTQPRCSFGREKEAADLRRRHLKIARSASAVVLLYVICMSPFAVAMFYYYFSGRIQDIDQGAMTYFTVSSLLNTVVDPIVYGLGMSDTRQAIKKELKNTKTSIMERFACFGLGN